MPRNRTVNSTIHGADCIIGKKNEFKDNIKNLNARNKIGAESLAHGGSLESTVRVALQNDDPKAWDNFEAFLGEHREKVKKFTESHIHLSRKVDAFIGALEEVKQEIIQQQQQPSDDAKPPDYEVILQTKMELLKQQLDDESPSIENHPWMVKTKYNLREVAKTRTGNGDDDDDDDVQVEFSNNESSNEYKCPITGRYMEDPMRNTVCGHVYDFGGIKFYMGSKRSKHCPVPGCANRQVTMSQIEQDVEMQLKVKRFLKRMEQERQQRMSQTQDVDDDF
jgi:hypothetical protein